MASIALCQNGTFSFYYGQLADLIRKPLARNPTILLVCWSDHYMERPRVASSCGLLAAGLLSLAACRDDPRAASFRSAVLLVAPDDPDDLDARLAQSMAEYLSTITDRPVVPVAVADADYDGLADLEALAAHHRAGLVVVLSAERLASDEVDASRMAALGEQGFVLETHDVGDWTNSLVDEPELDDGRGATVVLTAGAARLPRQYAAYELLRRLGVRFYHPEQEHVPVHDPADLRDLARRPTLLHREGQRDYLPDFAWRSWSFHSAHPLEHLEAFSDPDHPIDEAVRVNDWIVKGFGNRFRGAGRGVVSDEARARRADELEALRVQLGFATGSGIQLHNLQQGASAEIDPASPIPVQQQIETLVTDKLAEVPDARWFGIHFGPTEFTTTPDEETVQWIDWAGQAALRLRPDIEIEINNHITGSQPTLHYDDLGCPSGTNDEGRSDYYDLAFHSDPRLGVSVHTVMFYPLEGPAPVYAQRSFAHKRCLMEQATAAGRPLTWFPEGAWWLSFDNSVPVYLPLYLWARARDIELVRPLLASRGGTLRGHRMFDSGHEWGYWQQDYLVGLMAWNADATLDQVLGEIFDPLCEPAAWRDGCAAKAEAIAVLHEIMDQQRALFLEREDWRGRPGGLYAYFAGEDDADVLAADSGLEFRPVRVAFRELLGWDEAAIAHFRATDLAALHEAAAAYEGWRARLEQLEAQVPATGRAWLDEVRDGVEIDGLRAAHTALAYEAVLRYREAVLAGEAEPGNAAHPFWLDALGVLASAQQVIQRREAEYRYPGAQVYGGGLTPATAVDNGTTYPYRVQTKAHLLTYWTGRQAQVTSILVGQGAGETSGLQLDEALASLGEPLAIEWPQLEGLGGAIDIGGLGVEPPTSSVELGDTPGYWPVSGELLSSGAPLEVTGAVVRSDVLATTPAKGMTLLVPTDPAAQGVLSGVLPALRWAWLPEPAALAFAPDPEADGSVRYADIVYAPVISGSAAAFRTARVGFALPVGTTSGGEALTITMTDVELSGSVDAAGIVHPLVLAGQMSVADIVVAAIALGGFDEAGTLALLGGVWGFDPSAPPESVPIEAELTVE